MTAKVMYYVASPEDDFITLCIVCDECSVQWGWGATEEKLKQWAKEHNELRHSESTTSKRSN